MKYTFVKAATAFLTVAFALTSTSNAQSVRVAGNGGNAVVSPNGSVRFLDLARIPSKQLIDVRRDGYLNDLWAAMSKNPGFDTATYFPPQGGGTTLPVWEKLQSAIETLIFYKISGPIPDAKDHGTVVLKWKIKGKIVPLALQHRKSGTVLVDGALFDAMPRDHRNAFFMHEGWIRAYNDDPKNPDLESTDTIGALVHDTIAKQGLSATAVARYLCDIGITATAESNFHLSQIEGLGGAGRLMLPKYVLMVSRNGGKCQSNPLTVTSVTYPSTNFQRILFEPTNYWESGTAELTIVLAQNMDTRVMFLPKIPGLENVVFDDVIPKDDTDSRLGFWQRKYN